jgi:membrane protein involved in colicin uptake
MRRPALAIAAVAFLGLLAAAGIGLLVNEVSGDSIGLAAEPLSAAPLAPPEASQDARERRRGRAEAARERAHDRRERARERQQEIVESETPPTVPAVVDDHGGDDSGSGSDNSGSGSDNSGSGSSGSDSSGSGSGSSGSDDSGEFEDD